MAAAEAAGQPVCLPTCKNIPLQFERVAESGFVSAQSIDWSVWELIIGCKKREITGEREKEKERLDRAKQLKLAGVRLKFNLLRIIFESL